MRNADGACDGKPAASGFTARFFPSGLRAQYWDGALAIFLLFMMQIIIYALGFVSIFLGGFSAAIMGMMLLAVTIGLVDWAVRRFRGSEAVGVFYHKYLKGPTDLLNKHMSVGFTVPFVQIFRNKPASSLEIGLITAMFVLMGVLSPVLVYYLSYAIHTCSLRFGFGRHKKSKRATNPAGQRSANLPRSKNRQNDNKSLPTSLLLPSSVEQVRQIPLKRFSDQSTLMGSSTVTVAGNSSGIQSQSTLVSARSKNRQALNSCEHLPKSREVVNWILRNPCLVICIVSIPISIGVAASTGITVFADTSVLLGTWMTTLALQARARTSARLKTMPRRRTALVVGLNPVLITAGVMIAYVQAKHAVLRSSVLAVLDTFQSGLTFAGFLMDRTAHDAVFSHMTAGVPFSVLASSRSRTGVTGGGGGGSSAPCMGAGDIALTILESGLVAWGLKLFEYRRALVSHAGLVVLVASATAAGLTVVLGPLLAHAAGLAGAQSIAFAVRSVTLALGTPVMVKLGGDVGVNAAMVVFNGIVFQMAMGLGLVGWIIGTAERCCAWVLASIALRGEAAQLDLELGNESSELTPSLNRFARRVADGTRAAGSGDGDESPPSPPQTAARRPQHESHCIVAGDNCPGEQCQCRQPHQRQPSAASSSSAMMLEAVDVNPHSALRPDAKRLPWSAARQQQACPPQTSSSTVDTRNSDAANRGPEDSRTVAVGITVGINAAAMGTSYLYEQGSRAAPYSALAMTLFGVMTVIFTSITPLTAWLLAQVGLAAAAP
ncbi:hypothetical protein PpBr36_02265 [Pyricularia pennisetigena]|uniref:hypothetical protein n=1 Tax=Pyricularia pennisetigena TaxID=1578925 RepID=UPI001153B693|nr:hypothetical protein PpBr36_02265 [Pyricularia pennisetigena]TLS30513.1 hypothetical protein PpBr36_02265 [Pyricularia pennisetigena]